jgi:hypothetical protein
VPEAHAVAAHAAAPEVLQDPAQQMPPRQLAWPGFLHWFGPEPVQASPHCIGLQTHVLVFPEAWHW